MKFRNTTTDQVLEQQLERINACYAKGLKLIREAETTANEITITERLRPLMKLVQELEDQSKLHEKNVIARICSSKSLSILVGNQKLLLAGLLEEIQKIELRLTAKQSEISPMRDRQRRIQEMQTAYQQHK